MEDNTCGSLPHRTCSSWPIPKGAQTSCARPLPDIYKCNLLSFNLFLALLHFLATLHDSPSPASPIITQFVLQSRHHEGITASQHQTYELWQVKSENKQERIILHGCEGNPGILKIRIIFLPILDSSCAHVVQRTPLTAWAHRFVLDATPPWYEIEGSSLSFSLFPFFSFSNTSLPHTPLFCSLPRMQTK